MLEGARPHRGSSAGRYSWPEPLSPLGPAPGSPFSRLPRTQSLSLASLPTSTSRRQLTLLYATYWQHIYPSLTSWDQIQTIELQFDYVLTRQGSAITNLGMKTVGVVSQQYNILIGDSPKVTFWVNSRFWCISFCSAPLNAANMVLWKTLGGTPEKWNIFDHCVQMHPLLPFTFL